MWQLCNVQQNMYRKQNNGYNHFKLRTHSAHCLLYLSGWSVSVIAVKILLIRPCTASTITFLYCGIYIEILWHHFGSTNNFSFISHLLNHTRMTKFHLTIMLSVIIFISKLRDLLKCSSTATTLKLHNHDTHVQPIDQGAWTRLVKCWTHHTHTSSRCKDF